MPRWPPGPGPASWAIFWATAMVLLFGLPLVRALCRPLPQALPLLGEVPTFRARFAFGPESGVPFDARSQARGVAGRAWVASFVDPRDRGAEALVSRLERLQRRVRNLGDFQRIVSFLPKGASAVATDALYAPHHPHPSRFYVLAPDADEVERALQSELDHLRGRAGLRSVVGAAAGRTLFDRPMVFLIDRGMRLRGAYDLKDDAGLDALVADLGLVANFAL